MGQHERFLARVRSSSRPVFEVGLLFHARDSRVEMPPKRYAPTAAQAALYFDEGDLIIDRRWRYEVKGLQKTVFTCADDFPHQHVFVSNVNPVDRNAGLVTAYFLVSSDLRAAIMIPWETRPAWYEREARASNTNNVERFYCCPRELLTTYALLR